jgi:hypothetical protein
MDAYCTHQQYTKRELDKLKAKSIVLELGVGNGSSPLMYEFCKNNPNSIVYAFETDSDWYDKMFQMYGNLPNYVFNLIPDWNELSDYLETKSYNLVFVDQSPWEARIQAIDLLKDKTKIFILHDYDYYNNVALEPCNNIYQNDETSWLGKKYSPEFAMEDNYEILPPTLVMRKIKK